MTYELRHLSSSPLASATLRAAASLSRLDERIGRSPIRAGFLERQDFNDAVSSLWLDGELVHIEDLVLHEAHMNIRAPTHEVVSAHRIFRTRRTLSNNIPSWPFSDQGMRQLCGKGGETISDVAQHQPFSQIGTGDADTNPAGSEDAALSDEIAQMDALLARSAAAITGVLHSHPPSGSSDFDSDDAEWDEDRRLEEWLKLLDASAEFPPVLRAAVMLDAWQELQVLENSPWLGRQMAAAILRAGDFDHLPALNTGLRTIAREQRRSSNQTSRLIAILNGMHEAAQLGLKEHDRLLNGKARMERRLEGRRSNSRLPDLIELVLSRPVVSTSMIVKALGTTPQGAVGLAKQLELRELTGRGRFRAWGIM